MSCSSATVYDVLSLFLLLSEANPLPIALNVCVMSSLALDLKWAMSGRTSCIVGILNAHLKCLLYQKLPKLHKLSSLFGHKIPPFSLCNFSDEVYRLQRNNKIKILAK